MENFNEFNNNANIPERETGSIISHAFENYKIVIGYAVLALIIISVASSALASLLQNFVGYNDLEAREIMKEAIENRDFSAILQIHGLGASTGISFLVGLLFVPIYVGLLHILNKANFKQKIEFSDLFIGYRQNTGNIIFYRLIYSIAISIAFVMCILPALFLLPFFFLGLPILFFENKSAGEALSKSFELGKQNYGLLLGISLLSLLISAAGIFLCFIGIILTGFFYFAAMYSAYCAICGTPRQLEQ